MLDETRSGNGPVSPLLDKAIDQARQLPTDQQDVIAALMLDEIDHERRWDSTFARSQDVLERLAAQADEEDRRGRTKPLHPDDL